MGVETNSSTGSAERISKATSWGLSLRKVETRSLTRSIAFNPHDLKLFLTIGKPYNVQSP